MNARKFHLKLFIRNDRINKNGLYPVYARLIADKKLEFSTTITTQFDYWNAKSQRLHLDAPDAGTINAFLDSFCSKVLSAFSKMFLEGEIITAESLKEKLFGKAEKVVTLLQIVGEFNDKMAKRVGNDISQGSYKNYRTTKKFLEEFIYWQYKKRDMPIGEVKYAFCEYYYGYLTTRKTCNNNGAVKHIQRLKTIVNFAFKMGYTATNNLSSYTIKYKPFYQVKLTWEEIQVLRNLKVSHDTMRKVLHVFLFQCFSGLAYADVKAITPAHIAKGIDGHLWLTMERAKTGIRFTVPVLKPLQEIINLYLCAEISSDIPLLPVLSNQKMNDYLKLIAELAKIGKPLSTHVARHTFATTITLQQGIPLETVSKMLGHSKLSTTQLYSVVTELKISKEMGQLRKMK